MPLLSSKKYKIKPEDEFKLDDLIEAHPKIGLILDLTDGRRTYSLEYLKGLGLEYFNIKCSGGPFRGDVPSKLQWTTFISKCLEYTEANPGKHIGVHCITGTYQTGFMICKYVEKQNEKSIENAKMKFDTARGHDVYSKYFDALQNPDRKSKKKLNGVKNPDAKKEVKPQVAANVTISNDPDSNRNQHKRAKRSKSKSTVNENNGDGKMSPKKNGNKKEFSNGDQPNRQFKKKQWSKPDVNQANGFKSNYNKKFDDRRNGDKSHFNSDKKSFSNMEVKKNQLVEKTVEVPKVKTTNPSLAYDPENGGFSFKRRT